MRYETATRIIDTAIAVVIVAWICCALAGCQRACDHGGPARAEDDTANSGR